MDKMRYWPGLIKLICITNIGKICRGRYIKNADLEMSGIAQQKKIPWPKNTTILN